GNLLWIDSSRQWLARLVTWRCVSMTRWHLIALWLACFAQFAQAQAPGNSSPPTNYVLQLDGTNSYVQLPAIAFTNLTAATVEGWLKWDEFRKHSRFFDFGETNHSINVQNRERQPDLWFEIAHGLGTNNVESLVVSNVLKVGDWCHVAAVSGPG